MEQFQFADTYGSLMTVTAPAGLDEMVAAFHPTLGLSVRQLEMMMRIYKIISQKYDVVCTNPPYMGSSGMNAVLSDYVKKNYPDSKSDLFACFMEKCGQLVKRNGLYAMITQHAWMFLSSYEKLREKLKMNSIVDMAHLGARAFDEIGGEVVQTTAFVSCGRRVADFKGTYVRLVDIVGEWEKEAEYRSGNHRYIAKQENFSKIPGSPVAYWVSENWFKAYDVGKHLGDIGTASEGVKTGDNNRFLRLWFEISKTKFSFCGKWIDKKWIPHSKGGEFRKWYGNLEYAINWSNNGEEIKSSKNSGMQGKSMYFKNVLCWSKITSKGTSLRYMPENCLFDSGSPAYRSNQHLLYVLAFVNTVGGVLLSAINPTLNCQVGDIKGLPLIIDEEKELTIDAIVNENIEESKSDWDSFETSWDFERHPLV